jgi:hypothetical protein
VKKPGWVIWDCGRKNIIKGRTLHQGSQKLSMTENNFIFLIQQKKRFLKKWPFLQARCAK